MEQKDIYELLAEKIGAAALGFTEAGVEPWADVAPDGIAAAALFLRDDARLQFNQLMCLSGLDWDGYDENGKGKSVAILGYNDDGSVESSDRVGEGDLGVAYHLYSHELKHKFTLRVRVPRATPNVPTVSTVWATAGWHEREAWDMLGIHFPGHQDLRRMLLEESWVGHPLRKDYQMPEQWDGVQLKGENLIANPFPVTEPDPVDNSAGDQPAEG